MEEVKIKNLYNLKNLFISYIFKGITILIYCYPFYGFLLFLTLPHILFIFEIAL